MLQLVGLVDPSRSEQSGQVIIFEKSRDENSTHFVIECLLLECKNSVVRIVVFCDLPQRALSFMEGHLLFHVGLVGIELFHSIFISFI